MGTGFMYFTAATVLFAVQLMMYMKGSPVAAMMDFGGWLFFVTSCVSHAACLALLPFLVLFTPFGLFGRYRTGGALMAVGVSLLSVLIFLNMQVYDIYRFHINGFVLNMVTGDGAGEIFTFDTMLYVKEVAFFLLLIAVSVGLWVAVLRYGGRVRRSVVWPVLGVVVGCTLFAHVYHIYAAFMQKSSVIKSQRLIPYYFPTTANGLMLDHGFVPPNQDVDLNGFGAARGDICYPLAPLKTEPLEHHPNILFILLDSWNKRTLTAECMPNAFRYATEHEWYDNHFSCSNGTRSSIFGLFFSVPSYYWDVFESGKVSPLFIDELLRQGYQCQVFPGAQLFDPPFHRVVFQNVPNLNVSTEGNSAWERDRRLTDNFLTMLRSRDKSSAKPFFSFLFYDLPHSFELSEDKLTRFQPSWKYADYTRLNNDTDPVEFFNLYRNTCYQVDLMLADVFRALEEEGVADNTIVVITGDHGQEFNENRKNFWGHNGNFSKWQVGIPLICNFLGEHSRTGKFSHRTTHYDIVPTVMRRALGVTNPIGDYSMGHTLDDTVSRRWHVVGSELNYAFILDGDTILEKTAEGGLEVTDGNLNPVEGYHIDARGFDAAVKNLNRFLK